MVSIIYFLLIKKTSSIKKSFINDYPFKSFKFNNIEVITVDDLSKDNIRYEIENINDIRIKYIILSKKRACYARNLGIKFAKGKFI